jgi:hypothetical protein
MLHCSFSSVFLQHDVLAFCPFFISSSISPTNNCSYTQSMTLPRTHFYITGLQALQVVAESAPAEITVIASGIFPGTSNGIIY